MVVVTAIPKKLAHEPSFKQRVLVSDYLNKKEYFDQMDEMMGCETIPVDLNGQFAPIDKNVDSNMRKTQESIDERMFVERRKGGDED
jgi:hypothetical protein